MEKNEKREGQDVVFHMIGRERKASLGGHCLAEKEQGKWVGKSKQWGINGEKSVGKIHMMKVRGQDAVTIISDLELTTIIH